jgi:heme exporter protein C
MAFIKLFWWKLTTIALLFYVLIAGLLSEVPRLHILNETIRALYFHVPMWFGMIILLMVSMIYGIRYLSSGNMKDDFSSLEFANTGILLGFLGIFTGMIWANFTWGSPWSSDPKQNAAAVGLLIYLAYKVLRNSIPDEQRRGRVSAVYNIFAFATLIPLLFILPRMTDSLHPGSGGNPGFNAYDLDSRMRIVFYPAVIGWTLFGVWITTLRIRYKILKNKLEETEYSI